MYIMYGHVLVVLATPDAVDHLPVQASLGSVYHPRPLGTHQDSLSAIQDKLNEYQSVNVKLDHIVKHIPTA